MIDQVSLALTGASGIQYGMGVLKALLQANVHVHLMISDAAYVVAGMETQWQIPKRTQEAKRYLEDWAGVNDAPLSVYSNEQWTSPVASGSGAPKTMVVCPCSMGSLSAIATGASNNLIERAADVVIKEQGRLIIVPRETPFSVLHLENMLSLARMGALILPACPGFYHQPQTAQDIIDFVVARVLDQLGVSQTLLQPWGRDTGNGE